MRYLIICLFVFFLVLLFILLQPRISSSLFSFKREQLLTSFLDAIKNTKTVNPKEFWKVREFYSPGHFVYDNRGIKATKLPLTFLSLSNTNDHALFPFLIYTSPLTQSIDYLTTLKTIRPILNLLSQEKMKIIVQTDTLFLGQKDNAMYLVFLASNKDLAQTNGFLDYQNKDKELTKDKQWLSLTRFEL